MQGYGKEINRGILPPLELRDTSMGLEASLIENDLILPLGCTSGFLELLLAQTLKQRYKSLRRSELNPF